MKSLPMAALLSLAMLSPVMAQEKAEGRLLAELGFEIVDNDENGFIDISETHGFGEEMFAGIDVNENALISETEFLAWDYGFDIVAEEQGKTLAYRTALRVVFSFWDRDGNGGVSRTEHRVAINRDFRRADLNGDMLLSEAEFFGGFSVMVAIRTALRPEATE